jgi:hypothetical protein
VSTLRDLCEKYPALLLGAVSETELTLRAVEEALSIRLPEDVRWFLVTCGYGAVNAIPNIRNALADTLRFRTALGLDLRYVVLNDMNDAGVVLLDTSCAAGPVIWMDAHLAGLLPNGKLPPESFERFEGFSDWVTDRTLELLSE